MADTEWAHRIRRYLDTGDFGDVTQDDLDRYHEHLSASLRLHRLELPDVGTLHADYAAHNRAVVRAEQDKARWALLGVTTD